MLQWNNPSYVWALFDNKLSRLNTVYIHSVVPPIETMECVQGVCEHAWAFVSSITWVLEQGRIQEFKKGGSF